MKYKVTHTQLTTLINVFQSIGIGEEDITPPANFEARLLIAIMEGLLKQLKRKVIDRKKKYSISMSDQEALAFWIFFSKFHFLTGSQIFEANLIDQINNSIHQKFTL